MRPVALLFLSQGATTAPWERKTGTLAEDGIRPELFQGDVRDTLCGAAPTISFQALRFATFTPLLSLGRRRRGRARVQPCSGARPLAHSVLISRTS